MSGPESPLEQRTGLAARTQDRGRIYQVGQGSQHITEHIEHHHYQPAVMAGGGAVPVVVPVVADVGETRGFIGRHDEVAELLGVLDPGGGGPGAAVISAVSGLAGVGKTALAWQVARMAVGWGWFPGGAVFVDLHGYEPQARIQPGSVFAPLLYALGAHGAGVPSLVAEQAAVYHRVLAERARQQRPVLLVLDNASAAGQVMPLLPEGRAHRVLVTSRHTFGALPGVHLVEIDVLDTALAVALLQQAAQRRCVGDQRLGADPAEWAQLARLCGYLPLALQVVAALLADEPGRPVTEWAAELAEAESRLEALAYEEVRVRAAFELSYRTLDEGQARLFRLLSAIPGPDVSTEVAAVLADLPVAQVRPRLAGLARAHLLQRGRTPGRWQLHDLIRLYAAEQAEANAERDQRNSAIGRVLDYYLAGVQAAGAHLRVIVPGAAAPGRFASRHQARAWLETEHANLIAAALAAATTRVDIAVQLSSSLVFPLAPLLAWRCTLPEWLSTAELAVRAARNAGDRRGEGMALISWAVALAEVRRFEEAVSPLEQAVVVFRDTGEPQWEGLVLLLLATTLRVQQRFEEAISAAEQAAAIFRETGERYFEGQALGGLGAGLRKVRRFDQAISSLEHAVVVSRETGDRLLEGIRLGLLGLALTETERFEEAISALQRTATCFHETSAPHLHGMALAGLGAAQWRAHRISEAIANMEQAVAVFQEIGDRYFEGVTLTNLGLALRQTQRLEEASTTLKQAATAFRKASDPNHEPGPQSNPGLGMLQVERLEEAIASMEHAVVVFRETGDSTGEATTLGNLSLLLAEIGRFGEARNCAQQAVALFVEVGADQDAAWARNLLERFTAAEEPRR